MSYVVYGLLLCLIIWGMRFAGKGRFNEDFMSLEATKCLQGLCAVCVMLHHISQTAAFRQSNELAIFPEIGFWFVGIFFFCSGYGLIKSMREKGDYLKTFPRKRLLTVLIPFYTMTLAFAIYDVAMGTNMSASQWVFSALGLVLINSHAWYVVVITLLYAAFYFAFTRIKSERKAFAAMGLFVFAQMALGIVWGHLAWWAGEPFWWQTPDGFSTASWWMMPCALWFQGEWWINSTILFFIGMLFARFEIPVVAWLKRGYWIKLAVALAAFVGFYQVSGLVMNKFSYWTEFGPARSLGIGDKYACLASQTFLVVAFVVFVFMVMMKARSINPVTKFLGKITLEIYLMHNLLLMRFTPLIANGPFVGGNPPAPIIAADKSNLMEFAAIVIVGGIILGTVFNFINARIKTFAISDGHARRVTKG